MKKTLVLLFVFVVICMLMFAACKPPENGDGGGGEQPTLNIDNAVTWIDYPAVDFYPEFSDPTKAETLTYEYDNTKLTIDAANNTITGLVAGKYRVVARSANYAAQFQVEVVAVDPNMALFNKPDHFNFRTSWANLRSKYASQGTNGATTVFLGDSFFDLAFWENFYTTFQGKDALLLGIGGTHTYTWETILKESFTNPTTGEVIQPKNLVINLGTNNIFDAGRNSVSETTTDLCRLFTVMHSMMPNTNIYYFSIAQRAGGNMGESTTITRVNNNLKNWCAPRSWINFVDVYNQVGFDQMRADGVHPLVESYSIYVDALTQAGIVIENKN